VIAMLLASSSELLPMRLRHRESVSFCGDRVPYVLDQFETLGDRELADLIEKGSCHGVESAFGCGLRQVETGRSPIFPS